MHRLLAFIALLLGIGSAVIAFSPTLAESTDPSLLVERDLLTQDSHPFSGTVIERYPTGGLYREVHYQNGRKEGEQREYGLNGKLKDIARFQEGKRSGVQEGWYNEGPKKYELRFRMGLLHGNQMEWHLNGNVFRQTQYVDGVETDKKILYASGEIFTNYAKRENRLYGIDGGTLCMEKKREGEK